MFTREEFAETAYTMSYEEYVTCDCNTCWEKENCVHSKAYRRLPKTTGGLGLCPNLEHVLEKKSDGVEFEDVWRLYRNLQMINTPITIVYGELLYNLETGEWYLDIIPKEQYPKKLRGNDYISVLDRLDGTEYDDEIYPDAAAFREDMLEELKNELFNLASQKILIDDNGLKIKRYTAICQQFAKDSKEWARLGNAYYTTKDYYTCTGECQWEETCDNENGGFDVSWAFHMSESYIEQHAGSELMEEIRASYANCCDDYDPETICMTHKFNTDPNCWMSINVE